MSKRFEVTDTIDLYFKEIEKVQSTLTKQQEHDLAVRIQSGDKSAINELVLANLKFVVLLANKFIGLGVNIDDLIQEGNSGMIEAAKRFTPDKGARFITYAQFWIRKSLNECIVEYGRTVRLPHNQEVDIYKKKVSGEWEKNLSNVELDRPIGDEGDNVLGDLILREDFTDPFEKEEQNNNIKFFLSHLSEEEIKIIKLFYGLEQTQSRSVKEVAKLIGMDDVQVNRKLKIARHKMRNAIKKK